MSSFLTQPYLEGIDPDPAPQKPVSGGSGANCIENIKKWPFFKILNCRLPGIQEKRELLPRVLADVPAERAHHRQDEGLRHRDQEHSGQDLPIRGKTLCVRFFSFSLGKHQKL